MKCPNCESKRNMKIGKSAVLIVMWLFASFFMFVGFLFPPLWILSFLLLLASPVAFFVKPVYTCKDCNTKFKEGEGLAESNV